MTSKDEAIDALHNKLVEQVAEDISECLDESEELNLSPGEACGICAAVLIDTLAHLMVTSQTPEHVMLAWCHDHYLAMQDHSHDKH